MTERAYRLVTGILVIAFLFFQLDYALWALLLLMAFEGATNWRIPIFVSKTLYHSDVVKVTEGENKNFSINYDAERMIRWIVLVFILLGTFQYTESHLWFFPWFMGFAIFGAGMSGICPVLLAIRWLGFK